MPDNREIEGVERVPFPWERRPAESSPAWQAFTIYRDDPGRPRSHTRVARQVGKNRGLVSRWSSVHEWVDRVTAYDAHLDAMKREAQENAILTMARRHGDIAAAHLEAAYATARSVLLDIQRAREQGVDYLAGLAPAEKLELAAKVARVIPALVQVERLARGQSTSHVQVSGSLDDAGHQFDADWVRETYAALEGAGIPLEDVIRRRAQQNGDEAS